MGAQAHLPTYRTMDQLKSRFNEAFNFPSPIGQEEVIKFSLSQFENMVQNENQSEVASVSLTRYAEDKISKDNVVHLLQIANMYEVLYERFGRQEYADLSEEYYKEIKKIGSNLPHALYGLQRLYKKSGQEDKMEEVNQKILELWPEDSKVKNELKTLENE